MVTRTRKLLGAALVLAIGMGLAWPFHRSGVPTEEPPPPTQAVEPPVEPQRLTGPVELIDPAVGVDRPLVAAPVAATSPSLSGGESASVAAAPRPALPPAPPALPAEYPTGTTGSAVDSTPVYVPLQPATNEAPSPVARVHVVHNGDTLGRLAHRYLGSEDRALDIFDVNREVLDNPHLLPIGAELKIPPR